MPLREVKKGGGGCNSDADCGSECKCSDKLLCDCTATSFTGPNCLANSYFYDNPYEEDEQELGFEMPFLPRLLKTVLAYVAVIGFLGFVVVVKLRKREMLRNKNQENGCNSGELEVVDVVDSQFTPILSNVKLSRQR